MHLGVIWLENYSLVTVGCDGQVSMKGWCVMWNDLMEVIFVAVVIMIVALAVFKDDKS